MSPIRKPFFFVAIAAFVLAALVAFGMPHLVGRVAAAGDAASAAIDAQLAEMDLSSDERAEMRAELRRTQQASDPPGMAVPYLALLNGMLAFAMVSLGLGMLLGERVHVKFQGILTLLVGLAAVIGSFVLLLAAFGALVLMVSLFLAAPWGTLAYLAKFGFFDRGGAAAALSLSMTLGLLGALCLVLAHRRFLGMKALVLLLLTALLGNVLTSFLHALVPIVLVSITDAIAAIVIAVLGLVWGLVLLIGGVCALLKLVL